MVMVCVDCNENPNLAHVLSFELEKGMQEAVVRSSIYSIMDPTALHKYDILASHNLKSPYIITLN